MSVVSRTLLGCGASLLISAQAARGAPNPTAFQLVKEGDRFVGEQSKGKVIQIQSEKSVGSLMPNVWTVVYYDPTATLKATEVKFGAGKMLEVKRPMRLVQRVVGGNTPLDLDKLKVDSDQAVQTVLKEPLLENIKATSTQLKLQRVNDGAVLKDGSGDVVWQVRLWAAKLNNPERNVDIGEVWVSAADGKVVKTQLHLDRLT